MFSFLKWFGKKCRYCGKRMWFRDNLWKGIIGNDIFYVHIDCIYRKASQAKSLKEIEALENIHVLSLDVFKEKFLKWTGYRARIKIRGKFKPRTAHEKRLWKRKAKLEEEE